MFADASYIIKLPPANKSESAPNRKSHSSIYSKEPTNATRPVNVGKDGQKKL